MTLHSLTALAFLVLTSHLSFAQSSALGLKEALDTAHAQNPEIREAEAAVKRYTLHDRMSLSPFLPQISLEAGYEMRKSDLVDSKGSYTLGVGRINLYNGGRDLSARKITGAELTRAKTSLQLTQADVSQKVAQAFFELLYINEALKLKDEALKENASQRQIAHRVARAGFTGSADVLEFDFRESALKTEIELLKHEKNVASRNLSTALGIDPRPDLLVVGDFDRDFVTLKQTTSAILVEPQKKLLEAEKNLEVAQLKKQMSVATWLPQLDLKGQYGHLEFADPEVEGSPAWSVGLTLTLPLFSGLETFYARQSAAIEVTEHQANLHKAQLNTKSQIQDNTEKMRVLTTLLELQKINMAKAENYYRATLGEYRRGVKNAPDVTEAATRLFSTRDRHFQLQRDQILAYLGLFRDPSPMP